MNFIYLLGYVISSIVMIRLLQGGTFNLLQASALISPFVLILMLRFRPYWLSFAIALLPLNYSFPILLIDRLNVGVLFITFLLLFYLADTAMDSEYRRMDLDLTTVLMICLAIGITLRLLYDRPGSARIGGTGGSGQAILYFLGAWGYFAVRSISAQLAFPDKHIRIILVIGLFSLAFVVLRSVISQGDFYTGLFYHRQMWLIAAVVLSMIIASSKLIHSKLPWFYIAGFIFLALSALTPHRSRPVFALFSFSAIAYIYGRLQKASFILILLGAAAMGGVSFFSSGVIPQMMQRSLSIVIPIIDKDRVTFGEVGWKSGFRAEMTKLAWKNIKRNPLAGKGFKFSREEISFSRLRHDPMSRLRGRMATTGTYHNSVLALSVFCGLPLGLLFLVLFFGISGRFLQFARKLENGPTKKLSALILGFFIASSGQMLMNGAGYDFFCICVLLGTMSGIMYKRTELGMDAENPEFTTG